MVALRVGVLAGAVGFCSGNTDGNQDCPCLGVAEPSAPWALVNAAGAAKDCHWLVREWLIADDTATDVTTDAQGVEGTAMKCMLAQVPHGSGDWTLYPQSYGARCFNHKEVGNKGCFWMGDLAGNNGRDMDGIQVSWASGTATADILDAIRVPTAAGRTALQVGTEMTGQALADHDNKNLEDLCMAGDDPCTIDGASVTCAEGVDNCDLKIYNDALADQSQHLAPSWCGDNVFCYVDGCQCGTAVSKSDYFPEQLDYSYVTCGADDVYAQQMSREQESATAGCNTANSDTTSSLATTRATCGIATVAALMLMIMK